MTTLYPVGYGTQLVTMEDLRARHEPRMHPEFARRLFAWLESQDGLIGIGGGFRKTQPIRPGFAPPGKSFHEAQDFASGLSAYAAVDLVARRPGRTHRAPTWDECETGPEYGVHTFIKSPPEPWHMQCVEMRGWSTWVNDGRPDPDPNFLLPSDPVPSVPQEHSMATTVSVTTQLIQFEGVVTVRHDGTPVPMFEYEAAKAANNIRVVPRAEVPDSWAFIGVVIAKAGPAGDAIADRFRAVGGVFPNAA